LRQEIFFEN